MELIYVVIMAPTELCPWWWYSN